MTLDRENLMNSIMESLSKIDYVRPEDLPEIDLYMDQVTTFMDSKLKNTARNQEADKILTKTMINNYAKNNLLPSPVKKKYTREHLIMLMFIYYFKGILSINDIQTLLKPLTEKYFNAEDGMKLEDVYEEIFGLEKYQVELVKKDIVGKYDIAQTTFEDAPNEEKELLQTFTFIGLLSFDVYVKKLLIEKMIDGLKEQEGKEEKKK